MVMDFRIPQAFFSQRVGHAALLRDPVDEAFRRMRVQVVDEEDPVADQVEAHGLREVCDELGFGAIGKLL
jgi:hypothetical protein